MVVEVQEVDEEFREKVSKYNDASGYDNDFHACSENIVIFAEKMLGLELFAWQKELLHRLQLAINGNYRTNEFATVTSRQIGKSYGISILVLWATLFNKCPAGDTNTTRVGVVSAGDRQAQQLLDKVRTRMRAGDSHAKKKGKGDKFFTDLLASQGNNQNTLTFEDPNRTHHELLFKGAKQGTSVHSYPPTQSVYGETFTLLIIDEAALIDDHFFYDTVKPTANAADAPKLYTSTPQQASGFFYEYCKDAEELGIDLLAFSIEAIRDEDAKTYKTSMREIEQLSKKGKMDEIRRTYYCEWAQGENNYFDPDDVDTVFTDKLEQTKDFEGPVDVGVDFGGSGSSRTVITVSYFDEDTESIRRVWHKRYGQNDDMSLISDLSKVMNTFNVQRIIPDDCPEGRHRINIMKRDKGWNVKPMNFSRDKAEKFSAFRSAVRQGRVQSYEDEDLRTEMKALKARETRRTTIIEAPNRYNDDLVDSFVMSAYFFLDEESSFDSWLVGA